jgi:hypothetical protein
MFAFVAWDIKWASTELPNDGDYIVRTIYLLFSILLSVGLIYTDLKQNNQD